LVKIKKYEDPAFSIAAGIPARVAKKEDNTIF